MGFIQPPWPSLSSKGWIQTIANQEREGIQKQKKQSKVGTASRQGPGSYSKNIHNNVFEFFYRTGAPIQVKDGNFRLNTRFLEHTALLPHHQPIKKGHKPCNPHRKCCLLFPGTRDDHPVMSPVWPLSISSLRGANSFKLTCCYYKGECWFQAEKYLDLDQVKRDFCSTRQAYAHAQQKEVTKERDLRPNSQEVSWV